MTANEEEQRALLLKLSGYEVYTGTRLVGAVEGATRKNRNKKKKKKKGEETATSSQR